MAHVGDFECRGDDEEQQPENNGEDVRKHDVRPPETMLQIPIDLLWLPPPRCAGPIVGILGFPDAIGMTPMPFRLLWKPEHEPGVLRATTACAAAMVSAATVVRDRRPREKPLKPQVMSIRGAEILFSPNKPPRGTRLIR